MEEKSLFQMKVRMEDKLSFQMKAKMAVPMEVQLSFLWMVTAKSLQMMEVPMVVLTTVKQSFLMDKTVVK